MYHLTNTKKYVHILSVSPESKLGTKRSHRTRDFSSKQGWTFKLRYQKNDTQIYIKPLQVFKRWLVIG